MSDYRQLELFDLNAYTDKRPIPIELANLKVREKQAENVAQNLDWEQLEIDLLPQQSNSNEVEFIKLAA